MDGECHTSFSETRPKPRSILTGNRPQCFAFERNEIFCAFYIIIAKCCVTPISLLPRSLASIQARSLRQQIVITTAAPVNSRRPTAMCNITKYSSKHECFYGLAHSYYILSNKLINNVTTKRYLTTQNIEIFNATILLASCCYWCLADASCLLIHNM